MMAVTEQGNILITIEVSPEELHRIYTGHLALVKDVISGELTPGGKDAVCALMDFTLKLLPDEIAFCRAVVKAG